MLKDKDLKIIFGIRNNSRQSLTELSRKIKIPVSTIFDKLRFFEGNYILKHTSLIDFEKLGYNSRMNYFVKTSKKERDLLISYLSNHPNVNNIYKINSGFDLMFETIFSNVKDLEDFNEEIESKFTFEKSQKCQVIQDIKREGMELDIKNN